MRSVLLIAILLFLNSCQFEKDSRQSTEAIDTAYNKKRIAILKDDSKESFALTSGDLETINEILKTAVTKYNIQIKNRKKSSLQLESYLINLKNYKRQYVPYKNELRQKEIWINCFCSVNDIDKWRTEIVFVRDGGKCYFNLKINLDKKSYSMISVNGQA